jgi:hypothetical protein
MANPEASPSIRQLLLYFRLDVAAGERSQLRLPAGHSNVLHADEYIHGRIRILMNDREVASVKDETYPKGFNGFALFGSGRAVFHDLAVEDLL